ncbi:MAG: ComEC/Rec2 family competence protein [Bacteroidales bacterium]
MDIVKEKDSYVTDIAGNSPLFIFTIFYLSGILYGYSHRVAFVPLYTGLILSFLAAFVIYIGRAKSFAIGLLLKTALQTSLFLAGLVNMSQSPYALINLNKTKINTTGEFNYKFIVKNHIKVSRNLSITHCFLPEINEGLILFGHEETIDEIILPGDIIHARIQLDEISSYKKEDFDFKEYYRKKRIFTQGFLTEKNHYIESPVKKNLPDKIKAGRDKVVSQFIESDKQQWKALFLGITIGEKRFIDADTKMAFASTGSMHILSVSGMHVSFFYFFLSFILSFLGRNRFSEIIKFFVITIILWLYCAIAGFSPSSVRAVVMINLLMLSKIISRKTITLNTLCASALIITIFSPQSLFDPGFQLSYAAFLSIIFINPKIMRLLPSKSKLVEWMWGMVSLSISCSIGTALITISLYDYFPLYFMIANIMIIPLTAVIIYLASSAFLIKILFGGGDFLIVMVSKIINVMIKIADKIERLPYSKIYADFDNNYRIVIIAFIVVCFTGNKVGIQTKRYIYAGLFINLIIIYFTSK